MIAVSNAAKILTRMRRSRLDWRIEDFKVLADHLGIDYDQGSTRHVVFRHTEGGRLSVPAAKPIKPLYVRLFLDFIDRLGGEDAN